MEEEKIYVDIHTGEIWKGPYVDGGNLKYAKLSGVTNGLSAGIIEPIWIAIRSAPDKENWLVIGSRNWQHTESRAE